MNRMTATASMMTNAHTTQRQLILVTGGAGLPFFLCCLSFTHTTFHRVIFFLLLRCEWDAFLGYSSIYLASRRQPCLRVCVSRWTMRIRYHSKDLNGFWHARAITVILYINSTLHRPFRWGPTQRLFSTMTSTIKVLFNVGWLHAHR